MQNYSSWWYISFFIFHSVLWHPVPQVPCRNNKKLGGLEKQIGVRRTFIFWGRYFGMWNKPLICLFCSNKYQWNDEYRRLKQTSLELTAVSDIAATAVSREYTCIKAFFAVRLIIFKKPSDSEACLYMNSDNFSWLWCFRIWYMAYSTSSKTCSSEV